MNPKLLAGKQPGPGRPVGSKNGGIDARQIMIDMGFNPIVEAIKRFNNPALKESTHNMMLDILQRKFAPDLRQVELTGANGEQLMPTIQVLFPKKEPDGDNS